jgi:predicted  nucleic acid-binding Zn-ribbon protein
MPHQCVRCNTFYADDAEEIISGCSSCTGKLFFYVKAAKIAAAKEAVEKLTEEEKDELIEEVEDTIGEAIEDVPVVLDLESIRVDAPGKYSIDLKQLMDGRPVIYKLGEGKYLIDLAKTFSNYKKK